MLNLVCTDVESFFLCVLPSTGIIFKNRNELLVMIAFRRKAINTTPNEVRSTLLNQFTQDSTKAICTARVTSCSKIYRKKVDNSKVFQEKFTSKVFQGAIMDL